MRLQSLSIINYKNIQEADLEFSPKVNCFVGRNGMGKTNLLDAIYYLSFCKSHSNPIDSQNIRHEADFFVLQGHYLRGEATEDIYCGMKRRQKKQFKRNRWCRPPTRPSSPRAATNGASSWTGSSRNTTARTSTS